MWWKSLRRADRAADRIAYWPEAIRLLWGLIIAAWSGVMAWRWSFLDVADQYGAFGYGIVFITVFFVLSAAFACIGLGLSYLKKWRHEETSDSSISADEQERKRQIVREWRAMISDYMTTYDPSDPDRQNKFKRYIATRPAFAHLRKHMRPEVLKKLEAPRTMYSEGGGVYPPLVSFVAEEIDRFEDKWGVLSVPEPSIAETCVATEKDGRQALIDDWFRMVDEIENGYDHKVPVKDMLSRDTRFFSLYPYLSEDAQNAADAFYSGVQVRSAMYVGLSPEQHFFRMLRKEIGGIKRAWDSPTA